jgi:negative regulator of replication initiation
MTTRGIEKSSPILTAMELAGARTAIARHMLILRKLHDIHGDRFAAITEIRGRRRLYFSTSHEELDRSGSSVFPRSIEGTRYFAATNLSDDKKERTLLAVLWKLGYERMNAREIAAQLFTAASTDAADRMAQDGMDAMPPELGDIRL